MSSSIAREIRLPLLTLLLLIQAFLLVRLDWTTSPNRTELGHMAASLRLWETGRFDLFHVNPPLLRMIVGPAVATLAKPNTDWTDYSPDPTARSEWATGVAFIRANDPDTVRQAFFLGRLLHIPLILLGGYFGCRYSRELFGDASALIFLALWTFSPLLLGWGATICPDVAAASLGVIAAYTLHCRLKKPTAVNLVLTGLTLGLLPLTKLTWIIALLLWPAFLLTCQRADDETQRRPRPVLKTLLVLLIAVFTINLGYFFDGSFKRLGDYAFHSKALTNENGDNRFGDSLPGSFPVPFPEQFVLGFDTQKIDFERGMPSYLLGEHADHGWWYYYLVAFAVKEPIGHLLLAVLAFGLFFFKRYRSTWRDELVLAIPMLTLFLVVSSQTGFSLHARYIIPLLPFFYIGISRAGKVFLTTEDTENLEGAAKKPRILFSVTSVLSVVIILSLLAGIASSLYVYPHSMSYENEAFRNRVPPVLLGSNLDWGQDYYELKEWLDEHPEARPLHMALTNIFPIETLGVKNAGPPPRWNGSQQPTGTWMQQIRIGPKPGWYLLGVNELYGPGDDYRWLRRNKPVQKIGESLYLYHVTLDDANRLRREDDLPVLLEEDLYQ